MKKRAGLTLIGLLIAVVLSTSFIILSQQKRIQVLENSLPYLPLQEKIDYFDLIDREENRIDKSVFEKGKISLVYIFQRPCSPCNKNIVFWNKIASQFKNQVKVYGIIADDYQDFYNQADALHVNFHLYCPDNLERFLSELRIRGSMAQTILYANGVRYLKLGDLESEDVFRLIDQIKEEIKENG